MLLYLRKSPFRLTFFSFSKTLPLSKRLKLPHELLNVLLVVVSLIEGVWIILATIGDSHQLI